MTFKIGDITLIFDLQNKVYSANPESAIGKTYTYTLLKSLIEIGRDDILLVTYDDVRSAGLDRIKELVTTKKYTLIFMDKADLYMTRELFNLLCATNTVVFMDYKSSPLIDYICGFDCCIDFNKDGLRYYEDTI